MRSKFIIVLLFALGCTPSEKKETNTDVKPVITVLEGETFKEKLSEDPEAVLLDVRTSSEAADGIIPGAKVIDFNSADFADRIATLDKDKTYFVYCKVGARSAKASAAMEEAGFKNLFHLKGGYEGWVERGFETVKP